MKVKISDETVRECVCKASQDASFAPEFMKGYGVWADESKIEIRRHGLPLIIVCRDGAKNGRIGKFLELAEKKFDLENFCRNITDSFTKKRVKGAVEKGLDPLKLWKDSRDVKVALDEMKHRYSKRLKGSTEKGIKEIWRDFKDAREAYKKIKHRHHKHIKNSEGLKPRRAR